MHSDLFWAARGGGAGFPAIVTQFELQLQQLPSVISCTLTYPVESLPTILRSVQDIRVPGAEISVIARASDPLLAGNRPSARLAIRGFGSTAREARGIVQAAIDSAPKDERAINDPALEEISMQEIESEGGLVAGFRYAVDGGWIEDDFDAVGDACAEALIEAPSMLTRFVFARGQYPSPEPDVAFTVKGSMTAHAYATWVESADDHVNLVWLHDAMENLGQHISGFWVAQSNLQSGSERARKSYSRVKWERLSRIRSSYDPNGHKFGFLE